MSNASEKQPWISLLPLSTPQHNQIPFHHQSTTSDGSTVKNRIALPLSPQKDDVLTEKSLQELYHEAYLLLKDVINARKLNKNASDINIHNKRTPKRVPIHKKTSSSRQSNLLGQSPLPPFKTRQKNSTSFPVANISITPQIYNTKILNSSNFNRSTKHTNGYFKISTVNQANFIQSLLGKNWIHNKQSNEKLFKNKTKQLQRNDNESNGRKTQLFLKNNKRPKNSEKNTTNISTAISSKELKVVQKIYEVKDKSKEKNRINTTTDNYINGSLNWNSSRLESLGYTPTNVIQNLDKPHASSSSSKYRKSIENEDNYSLFSEV